MKVLRSYISLLRLNYQINFFEVILGIFLVLPAVAVPFTEIMIKTVGLFFCFVLFYGGLYTVNDIVDAEDDKKDERKKLRALPSGKIPIRNALFFAMFLITTGFFAAYIFYGGNIAKIFLLFFTINLLYTFFLKNIAFVELFVNCLTHPLRIVLGASLAGASVPSLFLVGAFFVTAGFGLQIRRIMMENRGVISRPSLRYYTQFRMLMMKISFLAIVVICSLFDRQTSVGWYVFIIFPYILFVLDLPLFASLSRFFRVAYIGK